MGGLRGGSHISGYRILHEGLKEIYLTGNITTLGSINPKELYEDGVRVSLLTLGELSTNAYRGDRGKIAYDHSQLSHAPSNAEKNSDITKSEIEAKLTGTIGSHDHSGTYEPVFSKNTGFNKNLGTIAGTVSEGNHNHDSDYNNYSHPIGFSNQPASALTGASVISQVTVNSEGHVTGITSRDLTKSNLSLDSVDNTSDLDKPISTAVQSALDAKSGTGHNHSGVYEPAFSKNTGFNKNFGTIAGTVSQGNHEHSSFSGDLTLDNGDNTTLTLLSNDNGESIINLIGDSQGTGKLFVGQSLTHGGGIEYNGDGTPTASGSGSDYITLYRRTSGVDQWTAKNLHSSNDWEFRANITLGGTIDGVDLSAFKTAYDGHDHDGDYNNYAHPTGFSNEPASALTDANVISQISVNSEGHVTGITSRGLTKANIGLGSVDNKSSATIRGEITLSNVTDALTYTPVNKAGDTMTGDLTIQGKYSQGDNSVASGGYAHAEGKNTVASGNYAHAEGMNSDATQNYAHAEGYNTTASASASHAEGYNSIASGNYSHAGGLYTIASGANSTAIGKYNVDDATKAFMVGVGTGSAARANGLSLDWNGNLLTDGNIEDGSGHILSDKENTISEGTISQYLRGDKSWQTLNKSSVGLGSVDNNKQMPIGGGTFTGVAVGIASTAYSTRQLRNVIMSTSDPSGGSDGDIWIKYS